MAGVLSGVFRDGGGFLCGLLYGASLGALCEQIYGRISCASVSCDRRRDADGNGGETGQTFSMGNGGDREPALYRGDRKPYPVSL